MSKPLKRHVCLLFGTSSSDFSLFLLSLISLGFCSSSSNILSPSPSCWLRSVTFTNGSGSRNCGKEITAPEPGFKDTRRGPREGGDKLALANHTQKSPVSNSLQQPAEINMEALDWSSFQNSQPPSYFRFQPYLLCLSFSFFLLSLAGNRPEHWQQLTQALGS